MKFAIYKASEHGDLAYTEELNTIEDLKKLYNDFKDDLVIRFDPNQITVYDDYLE